MIQLRPIVVFGLALALLSPVWSAHADAQPKDSKRTADNRPAIDPEARRLLRQMSDSMKALSAFRFSAAHETDVVLDDGQKLQVGAESRISVQRPNHVRSDRRGELADVTLYYDGESITVHGHRANFYATAKAPPKLDAAIDFLRERLGMDVPAGDLLYSDLYDSFVNNAVSGRYIGKTNVRGRLCHHLAFRGKDTDWQLWVEDSSRALPCKYVVTSTDVAQAPQFTVELYGWEVPQQIKDDEFAFRPPKDAERIDFLGLNNDSKPE